MNENHPQEFVDAINALYAKYGTDQTVKQKINILIEQVGDCCVHCTPMYKTEEEHDLLKMALMEMDYLEKIGVYKPIY